MDFALSPDAQVRVAQARQFAEDKLSLRPRPPGFDRAAWDAVAGSGLFGLALPPTCGGQGQGALVTGVVLEGLGRGGADRSLLFALGAHLFGCAMPIATYATAEQAQTWGDALRCGSAIGALAVTETSGGSSLEAMITTAVETPDGYLLTGEKALVTNAPVASLFLVLARQFPDQGPLGWTAFVVPREAEGLDVRPISSTAGLPGAPMGIVKLDRCRIPATAVLGRPRAGLKVFATAMQWERTCLLAGFLGAAERDLGLCVRKLHDRSDREGSMLRHQAVSHRLARMQVKLDGARLLAHRAAWNIDQGHADYAAAATAKLAVSEAIVDCAQDGLRLLAGAGWCGEPVDFAKALADTYGGLFASGTSEIQLEVITRHLQSGHLEK